MNVATVTLHGKQVPPNAYISVLPWSSSEAENKRFKLITLVILLLTVLFAILVKMQELPKQAREEKEKIPPQLTRLIKTVKVEPPKPIVPPKPIPLVELPKPEPVKLPPVVKETKPKEVKKNTEAVKVKTPTQQALTEQAKTKAKQSGLLALQDQLASMRDTPVINNLAKTQSIKGAGTTDNTQRQFVGKKVAASSGGLDTSTLSRDIGAKGELAERKNAEYIAPNEGLASLAAQELTEEINQVGNRTTESIRQVLDSNKGGIYAVYRRALRNDASLQGKLTVNIQIEPDGSVSDIKIVFSELDSPTLEADLVSRIKLINFGQQNVSQTLLDYSFNFLPF